MARKLLIITVFFCLLLVHARLNSDGKSYLGKSSNSVLGSGDRDFSNENLFTGDVAFAVNITSIGGVPVILTYKSNLNRLLRVDNAVQQAGWIGLGWSLNLGSIRADNNRTEDPSDDRYFYLDTNGSSELILDTGDSFRLKNYKYWKITREVTSGSVTGWTMVRENGTIFRYGNYNKATSQFVSDYGITDATQFSLGWDGLVSDPIATYYSSAELIPYKWDLSDIEDAFGNQTTINYYQEKASLSDGTTSTTKQYTRASYPSSIVDYAGRSVDFMRSTLTTSEYEAAPDETIQRRYQTKYFQEILFKDANGSIFQKYVFDHETADVLAIGQTKRYLTKITQEDANNNVAPATEFEYGGVAGVSSGVNDGALNKIIYPSGGEVEYTYSNQTLNEVQLDRSDTFSSSLYPKLDVDLIGMGISGSDFRVVRLTDGTDDFMKIYRWGTKGWFEDTDFPINSTTAILDYKVANDYVIVRESDTVMKVTKRKGDGWDALFNVHSNLTVGNRIAVAGAGNDFFIVKHNLRDTIVPATDAEDVSVVVWDNGAWSTNTVITGTIHSETDDPIIAAAGNRFFVLRYGFNEDVCRVFSSWDSDSWSETKTPFNPAGSGKAFTPVAGQDYFITYNYEATPKSISVWRWEGSNWGTAKTFNREADTGTSSSVGGISLGKDFFAIADNGGTVYIYTKLADSNQWSELDASTKFGIGNTDFENGSIAVGRYYVAIGWRQQSSNEGKLGVLKYTGNWSAQTIETLSNFGSNYVAPVISADLLYAEIHKPSSSFETKAYVDEGSSWPSYTIVSLTNVPASLTQPGATFLADVMNRNSFPYDAHTSRQALGQDFDLKFSGNPGDYPVTSKIVRDGMGNTQTTTLTYEKGTYDSNLNFAKYNKVTTIPPGSNGKTETFFYNDLGSADAEEFVSVSNYEELDGLPYRVKVYDNATPTPNLVSETVNTWAVGVIDTDDLIYHRRLSQTQSTVDGVTNTTSYVYNNTNGLVDESTETNSDGSVRKIAATYAFEVTDYSAMQTENRLAQVAQQTVYEGTVVSTNARSSTVTTWKEDWNGGNGKWAPEETYSWRESSSGSYSLPSFNFTTPPGDPEWLKASKVLSRDNFGNIKEVEDAYNNVATTKWGYNSAVPMAAISNANDSETFVDDFGDGSYSDGEPAIWTVQQGTWSVDSDGILRRTNSSDGYISYDLGGTVTNGDKIIEFDFFPGNAGSSAPGTDGDLRFRINATRDTYYRLMTRTKASTFDINLYRIGTSVASASISDVVAASNEPYHVKVVISGANIKCYVNDLEKIDYTDSTPISSGGIEFRTWWAIQNQGVDNVRVYPNDALATSQSFDTQTLKVTSRFDENGTASFFEYDNFNRLARTLDNDKNIISENSYYFSRDGNGGNFLSSDPNYVKTTLSTHIANVRNHDFENGSTSPDSWGLTNFGSGVGTWDQTDGYHSSKSLKAYIPSASASNRVRWSAWYDEEISTKKTYRMQVWAKTEDSYNGLASYVLYFRDSANNFTESQTITIPAGDRDWTKYTLDFAPASNSDHLYAIYLNFTYNGVGTIWYDRANYYELNITRDFTDGLGRGIQTLAYEGSGSIKTATIFDDAGRVSQTTKPFSASDLIFATDPVADANSYFDSRYQYYDGDPAPSSDISPYAHSKVTYYADPLSRVEKQFAPGDDWVGANRAATFEYLSNDGTEGTGYSANKLYKFKTTDEDGKVVETYTDGFGQRVATKVDPSGLNQLSLSEFDILGNVTKVIPPKAAGSSSSPYNSTYEYNTLSQLTKETTPDGGTTEYLYDKNGNLRFVKDAKGAGASPAYFVYFKYDPFNRITEEGQVTNMADFTAAKAEDPSYPGSGTLKAQYYYDDPSVFNASAPQRNVAGRLMAIYYESDRFDVNGWEYYSYDEDGNVEWLEKYVPKNNLGDDYAWIVAKMDYQYDALGSVTKKEFRRAVPVSSTWIDNLYVWYDYDQVGRLAKVFSNKDDVKPATPDAEYSYWPSGQVSRLELGGTAQGLDYLYNSRDWLTQINHQNLGSWSRDPGHDSPSNNGVTVDRFAQVIGYNEQGTSIASDSDYSPDFSAQYSGNISWHILNTQDNSSPASLTGAVFKYDNAARLTKANWGYYNASWLATNKYDLTSLAYDANGNLDYMTRYDENATATNMDYIYTTNTNKLNYISGLNGQTSGNYTYDASGNLTKDVKKLGSANTVTYNYSNLPTKIPTASGTIDFDYDADGQRVSKNGLIYVRGIDGNVLAVYDSNDTHLFWNLWGLDLIGQKFWQQ